jgi:hypothetical protein
MSQTTTASQLFTKQILEQTKYQQNQHIQQQSHQPQSTLSENTLPSQKITDATISGTKWQKLSQLNADRILIKARLSTNELGELAVKILENDKLQIRIAARVKAHKRF